MGDKIEIDHIGGWPKILREDPARPHDILYPEENDESDEPHDIEMYEARQYRDGMNIYATLSVISEFHKLRLYPPKWALDHLVTGIDRHLANPDPEEFAKQLGVSGPTSGSSNPYKEYQLDRNRDAALADVVILAGYFGLSFTDSARAVVEKHRLGITTKRLMNMFRENHGDFRIAMKELKQDGRYDPFLLMRDTDCDPDKDYISTYPRRAQNIIRQKAPDKT